MMPHAHLLEISLSNRIVQAVPPTCEYFKWLVEVEPGLGEIYRRARSINDDGSTASFCANHRWFGCSGCAVCNGGMKQELEGLVGWSARNPALRRPDFYDLAYDALYAALPPCRNCNCL